MYKKYLFLISILILLISCGTNKRDKNKLKHGIWITTKKTSEGEIKTKGRYKHGEAIGTWTTKINDTLSQKDKIKMVENDAIKKFYSYHITSKTYYPNGKIYESGESMQTIDNADFNERHWFKFGPWKRFDKYGKVILIKYYKEGKLQSYFENDSMHYDLRKFVDTDQ
ncbi:hypothetical protein [Soonwooa sp.]|uniref:hypothetical protein n=1 Tax=Soonwooa sp. TaxID=1938592 RepID=UPI002602A0EC|nr:hypothetical protein [Soonwooa sp.]